MGGIRAQQYRWRPARQLRHIPAPRPTDHHLVTGSDLGHPVADRLDDAGALMAQHAGPGNGRS